MARSARSNLYNNWYGNTRISGEISKLGQTRQEPPVKLFVLPAPLPSLVSARRSVSQPLTATADVYRLLKKNVFNKYERGDISFNHHRLLWPVTSVPSSDRERGLVPLL